MNSNNVFIDIKKGEDLTLFEIDLLNSSKAREWQLPPMKESDLKRALWFLVRNSEKAILAQGELIPIDGVSFNSKRYNIYGIGGIIANVKMQGYGKKLMQAIASYLEKARKTGVGFTGKPEFYRKCGWLVDVEPLARFVYLEGKKEVHNENDQTVFYNFGEDNFMKEVVKNPSEKVYLPRYPNW